MSVSKNSKKKAPRKKVKKRVKDKARVPLKAKDTKHLKRNSAGNNSAPIVSSKDNSYKSVPTQAPKQEVFKQSLLPVLFVKVREPEPEQEVIEEPTKRRMDWQLNHQIIEKAYWELTELNDQLPSLRMVSEMTGLSLRAVEKHYQDFSMSKVAENLKPEMLVERVIIGLAKAGADGNPKAGTAFVNALARLGFIKENLVNTDKPDWRDLEKKIEQDKKQDKKITVDNRMERIHDAILADNAIN